MLAHDLFPVAFSDLDNENSANHQHSLVQENGLSEGWDSHEGLVDCNGQPYKDKRMIDEGRKLYRAPGQRPILLPDLSKVPPA